MCCGSDPVHPGRNDLIPLLTMPGRRYGQKTVQVHETNQCLIVVYNKIYQPMGNPIPPEAHRTVGNFRRFLLPAILAFVLTLITLLGVYPWYLRYYPCEVNVVREASAFLISQRNTYDEAYQFATTVSRTSLEHPVNTLKFIFMDTQDVDVPACMQTAKDELIDYMGTVIRAFGAYGAGEADQAVWDLINQAETHYDNFTAELEAVNQCAPFCIPYVGRARLRR